MEQSDFDMSMHLSMHFQGCIKEYKRACPGYSDLCSDNRMPGSIRMSGISDYSKYVCNGEKALLSKTK